MNPSRKPARYPAKNTEELKAIAVFKSIIDLAIVKPDIKELDKFPNCDGYLELTNIQQFPMGKLEVQIKKLNSRNLEKPKIQIDFEFVSYCKDVAIMPVLFIVVDVTNNLAYWKHMSKAIAFELDNSALGKSVVIHFDKGNCIKEFDNSYYSKWIDIVNDYHSILINYASLKDDHDRSKLLLEELSKLTNQSIGKVDPINRHIHVFLDLYNNYLDNDFEIIKSVLYGEAWKVGLAYVTFDTEDLDYLLYPVDYEKNDALIKKIDFQEVNSDFLYFTFRRQRGNRIMQDPYEAVRRQLEEDVKKLLVSKSLLMITPYLAQEHLTAFIKKFGFVLRINTNPKILTDPQVLLNLIYENWPRVLFQRKYANLPLNFLRRQTQFKIDLDDLKRLDFKNLTGLLEEEDTLNRGLYLEFEKLILVSSEEFNMEYVKSLLNFLDSSSIMIQSPLKAEDVANTSGLTWGGYSTECYFDNVKTIISQLVLTFDSFMDIYFPKMKGKFRFFEGYDLLIVLADEVVYDFNKPPHVTMLKLRNKTARKISQKILFYKSGESPVPIQDFGDKIVLEHGEFTIVGYQGYSFSSFLSDTPVFTLLFEELNQRFIKFLKSNNQLT